MGQHTTMPRHGMNKNRILSIQLLNPQVYQPGDVVIGTVTVKLPYGTPPSKTLRLKLLGRAKTKITRHAGHGTRIYRGRAFFVQVVCVLNSDTTATQWTSDGAQIWPFDLEIPQSHAQTPASDKYSASHPFVSNTEPDIISRYEMPSIFYYTGHSDLSGTTQEAYVEYWLEASPSTTTATSDAASYPLFVRPRSMEHPTQDFDMGTRQYPYAITTQRLLPEFAADAKLTIRQRSRRFFAPSTVPRYAFRVLFNVAGTYQLDHPDPLPAKVWVAPLLSDGKTNIYNGDVSSLPPVRLVDLEAELTSECHTRAPSSLLGTSETSKKTRYPFGRATYNKGGNSGPVVPVSLDPESSAFNNTSPLRKVHIPPPTDALELGRILGLRVSHRTTEFMGRRRVESTGGFEKNNIYPSFATYNIALEHKLSLNLCVECAGEQRRIEVREVPLRILATAEQQARAREEELGEEGMRRNYDDLQAAMENGEVVSSVLDVVASVLGA